MRNFSLVRVDSEVLSTGEYPFKVGDVFCFLGEIPNMENHCVVVDCKTKEIHIGYHTDVFVELTEEMI